MTPVPSSEQVQLVRASFTKILGNPKHITFEFYENLFRVRPDLRSLFPSDMTEQRKKFLDALRMLLGAVQRLDSMDRAVRTLGVRHRKMGVCPAYFPVFRDAFIAALSEEQCDDFTEEVRVAWGLCFDLIGEKMMAETLQDVP